MAILDAITAYCRLGKAIRRDNGKVVDDLCAKILITALQDHALASEGRMPDFSHGITNQQ